MQAYIESLIRFGSTRSKLLTFLNWSRSICGWTILSLNSWHLRCVNTGGYWQCVGKMENSTSKSVREKVERQCATMDVIMQKLKLFGHIGRMEDQRLVKTVMLGMVEGDRPRGRPARRWYDDITDWCWCTLTEAVRLTLDRQEWRHITDLSSPHGSWVQKKKKRLQWPSLTYTLTYLLSTPPHIRISHQMYVKLGC